MAVIQKLIKVAGSKGSEEVEAIFDSGSTYSCIHPELASKLGMIEALPEPMEFKTAEEVRNLQAKEA